MAMKGVLLPGIVLAGTLVLPSCAASPALRAAEAGDRPALASAVGERERAGDLSNGDAASLARAVAEHELRGASGAEGVDRVRDVRPCARELDRALASRSAYRDEAAAEAVLARIEARALDPGDLRAYATDADARWRAVGVRAFVRAEDQAARARALLDADPGVRRAAARAARDAADPADAAPLADAARRDPEPIVRSEAVRSLAALPPTPGGATADLLRDLWTAGDDGLREDIALAWSNSALWEAGGREALRVVIASDDGPGAVEAAAAVLRRRDCPPDLAESARAQLARAMDRGSTAVRSQAIAQSPADAKELRPSLVRLADSDDAEVRVGALARLAELKDALAIGKLEALAQPGSPVGVRARLALASAGDRRVQAWIEQDLTASDPAQRLAAASALAALGVAARAAPLLADADARVRLRAACILVIAARRR
jgi:HEAT repeat protein